MNFLMRKLKGANHDLSRSRSLSRARHPMDNKLHAPRQTNLSTLASDFVTAGSLAVSKDPGYDEQVVRRGDKGGRFYGVLRRGRGQWDVTESWGRTKGREEVLREWRARHMKQGRQPARSLTNSRTCQQRISTRHRRRGRRKWRPGRE